MFYKDKKRAMMEEVIRQAGGENATKESILEVLFPDSGREYGDFYDYWMNYKKITIPDGKGGTKKITSLKDFVKYRNGDASLIVPKHNGAPKKGN